MITGKFEFGDGAGAGSSASPVVGAAGGLGEVLSGGIAAMPAAQAAAERQRTKEAQRIIGMVEPGMPQGLGGGGAAGVDSVMRGDGGGGHVPPQQGGGGAGVKGKDCCLQ